MRESEGLRRREIPTVGKVWIWRIQRTQNVYRNLVASKVDGTVDSKHVDLTSRDGGDLETEYYGPCLEQVIDKMYQIRLWSGY